MKKKKKVYIFNGTSRAAAYGIGTYITQLTDCLKKSKMEFEVVYLYAEGTEVSTERKNGYQQISIPAVQFTNSKNSQYYSRNVVYLLREFIPLESDYERIFHLNFMTNEYLVKQLKKVFKCRVILTAHYTNWSFDLMGDYKRLKKILAKKKTELDSFEKTIVKGLKEDEKMIKRCDHFICVAQHTLDSFTEISDINLEKGVIINNGLQDTFKEKSRDELNRIRKKYLINTDTKVILFAGRLDSVKGIKYLIQSFRKVLKVHPGTLLIIAGDGNFTQWLKEAEDCWARIIFTGRLEKQQLYEFYQIADVGVVSSIHEEFGFVAIEMMMHQLPVVVSNVGGLAEIIEGDISGLKVAVRTRKGKRIVDVNQMADKICTLLDDSMLAQQIGEGGRKRFLEKYELSIFENRMLNLYLNI